MTDAGSPFGQLPVALVTPMTADGEVDRPGVEKHIDDVIQAGADATMMDPGGPDVHVASDEMKPWFGSMGSVVAFVRRNR